MAESKPANHAYSAAHFGLELDQKDEVGLFRSIEGGGVKADVMTYQPGASKEIGGYQKWRQLGKPKFEDIKMQIGMAMSAGFYNWIADFMEGKPNRKSGAILAADFYYKERARREFAEAMIKELTIPKLDANDKNPVYMGVTIAVEDIKFLKGTGKSLADPAKGFDKQKSWTACNFTFSLNGFEDSLHRVTKIDSFTVKQNIAEYHAGGFKAAIKTPTAVEYPNIAFYIPESDAQPFYDRMQTQVGFGKRDGNGTVRVPTELHGSIFMNDPEGRILLEIAFDGAQVLSVTPDKQDSSSEEVKQVKIELYTESMQLKWMGLE